MSGAAPSTEDEIREGLEDMYLAFLDGDRARFDRHLAHDVTTWESHLPRLFVRSELDEYRNTRDGGAAPAVVPSVDLRVDIHRIDIWPTIAVARYLLREIPVGTPGQVETTRITDVLEHRGSEWVIVHHHAEARGATDEATHEMRTPE